MIATQPMTTDLPARFAALGIAVIEYAVTGADLARMDSAFGASVTASPGSRQPGASCISNMRRSQCNRRCLGEDIVIRSVAVEIERLELVACGRLDHNAQHPQCHIDGPESNIQEVRARHGKTIIITSRAEPALEGLIDFEFRVPETIDMLTPILASVPLQLLAYYIAVKRGANVDQPRNLAKSVTVE